MKTSKEIAKANAAFTFTNAELNYLAISFWSILLITAIIYL